MLIKDYTDRLIDGLHVIQQQLDGMTIDQPDFRIEVPAGRLIQLMQSLKTAKWGWFDHLSCLTTIDWGTDQVPRFSVLYHLISYPFELELEVCCAVPEHDGRWVLPSVSQLWPTAQWHEREAYDLLGIYFDGNCDLRRLFMPDDWSGHPLRRDYVDPEFYHGVAVGYYDIPSKPSA
jgi:NADH-quinone oxidoreductase subunit C